MRIPFDIEHRDKIESGEYKVETRDGKKVRVLCYDANNIVPVVALVTFNDGSEGSRDYYLDGRMDCDRENPLDLFIVTPEPEMNEWELAIAKYRPPTDSKETIQRIAAELLVLAKQQLLQSGELMTQEHHEELMETLREECKKDLPRWRNVEADKRYVGCVTRYMDVNGDWNYCMSSGMLSNDCQYISIAALEKLPMEDESHE